MDISQAFSPENIDKTDVAISGLQGALPWSVPGGKYGKAAVAALSDVGINYGKALASGENYDMEQAASDFMVGFLSQLGAEKAGSFLKNKRVSSKVGFKPFDNLKGLMGLDMDAAQRKLGRKWSVRSNNGGGWTAKPKNIANQSKKNKEEINYFPNGRGPHPKGYVKYTDQNGNRYKSVVKDYDTSFEKNTGNTTFIE